MTIDRGGPDSIGSGHTGDPPAKALPEFVGSSEPLVECRTRARAFMHDGVPILLVEGEPGTGRLLLSRTMHYEGPAPGAAFVALDCASIPPMLVEMELFGTEPRGPRDADDGQDGLLALVGQGTLFLRSAERLPLPVQERLVRWVRGVDRNGSSPRLILTVHRLPPPDHPESMGFLEPFHRLLESRRLALPPLRKRGQDIELLSNHFLSRWARTRGVSAPSLQPDVLDAQNAHPWPGNVRELRDVIHAAAELSRGGRVRAADLRIRTREIRPLEGDGVPARDMILIPPSGKAWDRIEEEAVEATLAITRGNQSAAARILGISRPTLSRKIRKYDLEAVRA